MKINNKKVITNGKFAYDTCHKIYVIEDSDDEKMAIEYGYHILDIRDIEDTYWSSCDLRFIHNWKLTETYVSQFEEAEFDYEI